MPFSFDQACTKVYVKEIDGCTDKLWTVQVKGGITFHVLDYFAYVGESVKNSLRDDHEDVLFKQIYQSMKHSQYLTYNEEVIDGLTNVYLIDDFTDKESLDNCFQALMFYKQQIENKDQSMHIYYSISFQNPLRKIGNYENIFIIVLNVIRLKQCLV